MGTPLPEWPDIQEMLKEVLAPLTAQEVVTTLPADLQQRLPLQRVRRIGGDDDGTTDFPRVDIEVYAATYAQARALAKAAQQLVLRKRIRTSLGLIDRGTTEVGPREIPYPDERIRMWRGTYEFAVRRTFTP